MTANIEKVIDEKIRKLQQLRELAQDEDMRALFGQVFSQNGKRSHAAPARIKTNKSLHRSSREGKGVFIQAVQSACEEYPKKDFSARDIAEQLEKSNHPFRAKNHYTAVLTVMKKLKDRGALRITRAPGWHKLGLYANVK